MRAKSIRVRSVPTKFQAYWDMSIPTEYYELDFIEFEEFMKVIGNMKKSTVDNPHAAGDYMLLMFRCYEDFRKSENKQMKLEQIKSKSKLQD